MESWKVLNPLRMLIFVFRCSVVALSGWTKANVVIIPPDIDIIINALKLKWSHKDPVDRFIIATAIKFNDYIVSGDSIIKKHYKKTII